MGELEGQIHQAGSAHLIVSGQQAAEGRVLIIRSNYSAEIAEKT